MRLQCVSYIMWSLFLLGFLCKLSMAKEEGNPLTHSCAMNNQQSRKLYVSTVDGMLTALDLNGEKLWSYSLQQPLFKSTLSYSEASEEAPNLIPGLNRVLYHWDGAKLRTLPFTADDLLNSAQFSEGQSMSLVGSKTKEVVGINTQNGKPLYECTPVHCHRYDNSSAIQRIDVLKLGISRVTIREAHELTGEELWNFTVGNMQLSIVEGAGDEFSCLTTVELPWYLQVDTVGGALNAVDRLPESEEYIIWKAKLSAPITDVWLHDGGRLEKLTVVSQSDFTLHSPSLMLVHYKEQYYIQPVADWVKGQSMLPTDIKANYLTHYFRSSSEVTATNDIAVHADLSYRLSGPAEPTASDGNKALILYNEVFAQMSTTGPNGLAVYFYMDDENMQCDSSADDLEVVAVWDDPSSSIQQSGSLVSFAWSILKYLLFGAFVMVLSHIRHHNRLRRLVRTSNGSLNPDDFIPVLRPLRAVFGEAIVERLYPDYLDIATNPSTETLTDSSTMMNTETLSENRSIPRFDSDYELKGHLGKGGFGVVYHVQNKIDGGEYAIKRIKLPTSKSAKDKVMREVHALARLDHPAIVRYFHSWVEKAPLGWTEMEEWMPLSRRQSYDGSAQSSVTVETHFTQSTTKTNNRNHKQDPRQKNNRFVSLSQVNKSFQSSVSPPSSFNSLNHSTIHSIVPPITTESRSSSFIIEFQDEGNSHQDSRYKQEGCFRKHLLNDRDDLLCDSSCSESIECRERQDSITELMAEPPTFLFIQMQLCQKESLKDWLAKNVLTRKKQTVMHFFEQILEAVLYVHQKGMMHRDLKPSNIFFDLDGRIKVGDFGLVTGSVGSSYIGLKSLGEDHKQHTGNIGTHFYISPEQLSGRKYSNKVDIFALGVIFFELLYPFCTQMERAKELDNLRNLIFPVRFKTHLPLEADMVEWLMTTSASKRPTSQEVADSQRLRTLKEAYTSAGVKLVPKL